ncbi:MAG: PAS domain-containing protein [Rhizomicrobium sp.]
MLSGGTERFFDMGYADIIDPADALNLRAKAHRWPMACDSALVFQQPELNELRDIWLQRAPGGIVPPRSAFDARTLKPWLSHIMIVERVAVGAAGFRYRMRLEGSEIVLVAGESTGRYLDDVYPPGDVPRISAPYDAVLDGRTALRVVTDVQTPHLDHLSAECFVAPLADANGEVTLVLRAAWFKVKHVAAARMMG